MGGSRCPLLLNTILTVRAGEPGSHEEWGWEDFTNRVISVVSDEKSKRVVFMLWGDKAHRKRKLINDYSAYDALLVPSF